MIIPNATIIPISYNTALDGDGFPMEEQRTEGQPISAQCVTITYNALAIVDKEHHTQATFQVLIEGDTFPFTRIMLQREGEEAKEYGVIKAEPLRAVSQVAIYV